MTHGDLISMSYLDFVKKLNPEPIPRVFKRPSYNGIKNTVLYLHGDSFTRHLNDTDFAGLYSFNYIDRNHGSIYHLDTTKRNILIIQVSERYLQFYYNGLQIFDEFHDTALNRNVVTFRYPQAHTNPQYAALLNIPVDYFFNKVINQNLQCNLFNYNFIIPVFEYKAALNYYIFNRASGDVVISKDKKFLFLKETVSHDDLGSSYKPINPDEITHLVDNFNTIYDHYISKGFSEVYLSVIPNAATIMQPEGYNNMIPLLQNDPGLKIKVIDTYAAFKHSSEVLYLPGDTHWNIKGLQLWLDLVNEKLAH